MTRIFKIASNRKVEITVVAALINSFIKRGHSNGVTRTDNLDKNITYSNSSMSLLLVV